MSHLLSISVSSDESGERLDSYLSAKGAYVSRSAAVKAIEAGSVFVNGSTKSKKYAVCEHDTIVYEVADEASTAQVRGQDIPLDIVFEDDDLLVLNKQAGLVCHPSVDHLDGTLVNALIYHCGAQNLCNVQGDNDRLGIVHRLDRDTTGLMLAAKTNACGSALMADIKDRVVDRHYLALCHGVINVDTGMIDAPIARDPSERTQMAVRESSSSREAITTFKVLERFEHFEKNNGYTLLDCKLFTGRTHQIRVHMQYTRHPLVGDPVYSGGSPKDSSANLGLTRQFLHSYHLAFCHPLTGKSLCFEQKLPQDLLNVIEILKPYSLGRTAAGVDLAALFES